MDDRIRGINVIYYEEDPFVYNIKKRTPFTRISKIEGNYTLSKPKDIDAQTKCIK
jgi:hypothetical protein